MRIQKWLVAVSSLAVWGLLLSGCAPAAPAPQPTKPAEGPATAPAAATPKPAAPTATAKPAAAEPLYGGTLPVSLNVDPPNLDLHQNQILAVRMAAVPAYDSLLEYNPLAQNEIISDLAERYEMSKDGSTYTFFLNKGVTFHDGAPLTSDDVKYNLDRLRNPPRGVLSPRQALLASIDKIETPDASTLKISTKYPDPNLLAGLALSHHVVYPKKVVEEKGDMKKTVLGTGPFKFRRYENGVIIEYAKNKDYFRKGRPYLDGLAFYVITDSAARFAAFRTGRVLMTTQGSGGLTSAQAEIAERELKGKARPLRFVGISNILVLININREPLGDVRVRQALNLVADRPSIIKTAFGGEGIIATFFLPEPYGKWELPNAEILKMPGYRPGKAADINEARKLLAEAGYDRGLSLGIGVRTIHTRAVEVLIEQSKAAGITLKPEILETGVFNDRKLRQAYDLLLESSGVDADDPTAWFENILSPDTTLKDPQLEEWIKAQGRIMDFEERKALVRRIQMRLFETLPVVPSLRGGMWIMGIWDNVRNYPEPIGVWNSHKYTEVWLAK